MKTIFETKDGKQFVDEKEANEYEYKLTLLEASRDFLEKIEKYIPENSDEEREFHILKNFLIENTKFN